MSAEEARPTLGGTGQTRSRTAKRAACRRYWAAWYAGKICRQLAILTNNAFRTEKMAASAGATSLRTLAGKAIRAQGGPRSGGFPYRAKFRSLAGTSTGGEIVQLPPPRRCGQEMYLPSGFQLLKGEIAEGLVHDRCLRAYGIVISGNCLLDVEVTHDPQTTDLVTNLLHARVSARSEMVLILVCPRHGRVRDPFLFEAHRVLPRRRAQTLSENRRCLLLE